MARVALLIGVSEYEQGLNPLPSAIKDVEAMSQVLLNPEMGSFAEAEVLKNPLRQEMEDKIYDLYSINCNQDDVLLLYFSGHGITDSGGEFYFSTRQTRKDQQGKLVPTSAVAAREVHPWMNASKSKRMVVILDCCFGAAFAKGLTAKDSGTINLEQHLGGEGRAILTASTSTQFAFEQEGFELSIYTQYLVEGIENGAADQDGDGLISVDELHGYASSKVREVSPTMTPEFYPVKQGYRIFLAKSPKDDPKLKYRQEVESRVKSGKGRFSVFALEILESKRIDWGLTEQDLRNWNK
ncbi:caspase family protein [Nostoc flagelliforme FACHB-838]|uniref:Caspase family protein n=1 Tax=Nostoc flagelliforme FACHB-838 TaxID=2692904 RepID=A0ABR8DYV5_9NOSO|nr:caspase family protein [Nostoc flagelliforme]MBD2534662.1 caspase family protein [Nostoc flagelliforme FACHB-838]